MMKFVFFNIFIICLLVWTWSIKNIWSLTHIWTFIVMINNKLITFAINFSNNLILLIILVSEARSVCICCINEVLRVIYLIQSLIRCWGYICNLRLFIRSWWLEVNLISIFIINSNYFRLLCIHYQIRISIQVNFCSCIYHISRPSFWSSTSSPSIFPMSI